MCHSIKTTLFLLLPLLGCAQDLQSYVQFNGSSHGPHDGFATLNDADQSPDAKNSVNFDFISPDIQTNGLWTWTLQTSNVSLPNISTSIEDAHVAYTTWHFAYDRGKDWAANLTWSTPTCVSLLDVNFPLNVSNGFYSRAPSCMYSLGYECEQAILNSTSKTDDCVAGNFHPHGERFSNACSSVFGPDGYVTAAYPFNTDDVTNGTFAWALSDPYDPSNSSTFDQAKGKLRLMILSGGWGKQVVCNRASDEFIRTSGAMGNPPGVALIVASSILLIMSSLWL